MASSTEWDDDFGGYGSPAVTAVPRSTWPIKSIFVLSALALGIAALNRFWWSVIAWAGVLMIGCGLIFVYRVQGVVATRSVGAPSVSGITTSERLAIVALVLGALANGLVIAFVVARR